MRFETWNVRRLYRAGSLVTVSKGLSKYKLGLLGLQEVRWEGSGTEPAGEYTFFYRKGDKNHKLGTVFFVHRRMISAVKRVEFVSDRMSYIILRGCWCHIIMLNVHNCIFPPNVSFDILYPSLFLMLITDVNQLLRKGSRNRYCVHHPTPPYFYLFS
jgi:hypothetical protein